MFDIQRRGSSWHGLQYDLFLYIVEKNADMFSDGTALVTTRRTAQVCRSWRDMMLATPALWGRLIDIDSLSLASHDWRVELLRRSGNALLSVRVESCLANAPSPISKYFFDILDGEWDRIQHLHVRSVLCSAQFSDWAPIFRPAPHLKTCVLHLGTPKVIRYLKKEAPGPLLANNAPMLYELNAWRFKFDIHAPWMARLRSLHIGNPFTLCEILTALEMAPNLEYLYVNDISDSIPPPPLRVVPLPALRQLTLSSRIKECVSVLDYLDVPPLCTLTYSPSKIRSLQEIEEDGFCRSMHVVSTFVARHFRKYTPRYISLSHHRNSLLFLVGRHPNDIKCTLCISCAPYIDLPTYASAVLFRTLTLREFAHVTKLQLHIDDLLPSEAFISFLACFAAVQEVDINERAITHLVDVTNTYEITKNENVPSVLFPVLKDLKIVEPTSVYLRYSTGVLTHFVQARRDAGLPLAILDLAQYESNGAPASALLTEVNGLTVRWTRPEDGINLNDWFGSKL